MKEKASPINPNWLEYGETSKLGNRINSIVCTFLLIKASIVFLSLPYHINSYFKAGYFGCIFLLFVWSDIPVEVRVLIHNSHKVLKNDLKRNSLTIPRINYNNNIISLNTYVFRDLTKQTLLFVPPLPLLRLMGMLNKKHSKHTKTKKSLTFPKNAYACKLMDRSF